MKFTRAIISSIVFLVALVLIYYFHMTYFRVNVVFYAAIADVFFAVLISAFVLNAIKFLSVFNNFEQFQIIIIWGLIGYSLAISIPTVIDRSLSFYILEKLQQRGGAIRQDSFEKVFTLEYVKEHHLVDVRLTEQLESGTIIISDGCVKLTDKGGEIASFGRYFRGNWLPKRRLLMGTYSDALTDPFRNSTNDKGYLCQ